MPTPLYNVQVLVILVFHSLCRTLSSSQKPLVVSIRLLLVDLSSILGYLCLLGELDIYATNQFEVVHAKKGIALLVFVYDQIFVRDKWVYVLLVVCWHVRKFPVYQRLHSIEKPGKTHLP